MLNKRGGPFTPEDESRLRAFTAQIASALENAKLFADVQAMRNYNEAMLESMSNGVITFDEESGRADVQRGRRAASSAATPRSVVGPLRGRSFGGENPWLVERMQHVAETREHRARDGRGARASTDETVSVNVTVLPLLATTTSTSGRW